MFLIIAVLFLVVTNVQYLYLKHRIKILTLVVLIKAIIRNGNGLLIKRNKMYVTKQPENDWDLTSIFYIHHLTIRI